MDEDLAIINSTTRNQKIKNFFINNKKILTTFISIALVILIGYFSYSEYKENKRLKISDKYNLIVSEYSISNKEQTKNNQLIAVRETFDKYNLISALHSYHSIKDKNYKNILPPLTLLSEQKQKELIEKLDELKFTLKTNRAA